MLSTPYNLRKDFLLLRQLPLVLAFTTESRTGVDRVSATSYQPCAVASGLRGVIDSYQILDETLLPARGGRVLGLSSWRGVGGYGCVSSTHNVAGFLLLTECSALVEGEVTGNAS
jgi:hypothetical protein